MGTPERGEGIGEAQGEHICKRSTKVIGCSLGCEERSRGGGGISDHGKLETIDGARHRIKDGSPRSSDSWTHESRETVDPKKCPTPKYGERRPRNCASCRRQSRPSRCRQISRRK